MTFSAVPPRQCGSCTLCCELLVINALAKPANALCRDCTPGQGCGIYTHRPAICRDYLCGWMLNPGLPDHWRPETSGMIIGRSLDGIPSVIVHPNQPDAWRAQPFIADLHRVARDPETAPGGCVAIICGQRRTLLYGEHEVSLEAQLHPAEHPLPSLLDHRAAPAPL